ncbi:MAG: outer membrane biosynthesis protein TonB [Myxococcota bacterium]
MSGRISWEIIASLWLHISLGSMLFLGERCNLGSDEPLFNPQDVMRVSMAPMPYAPIVQKASRAPEQSTATEQAPTPEPVVAPPTASEMVLRTEEDTPDPVEKPPEKDPTPPEPAKAKAKAEQPKETTNQAAREALLNPSAPEGTVDRSAAGPDGSAQGVTASAISLSDAPPAVQAYMQSCMAILHSKWAPLPSLVSANPRLLTTIRIPISRDGKFGAHKIVVKSGDNSFDRSADMAVLKTQRCGPFPATITEESLVLNLEFPASDKL